MFPGEFKPYTHVETFLCGYFNYEHYCYLKKDVLLCYHFFSFVLLNHLSVFRQF